MNKQQKLIETENNKRAKLISKAKGIDFSNILLGDSRDTILSAPDNIRLVLMDPPYGMNFVSNRRTASAKEAPIANDDTIEVAIELLQDILSKLNSKLQDDAHLLIFTGWKYEPLFRKCIEDCGYTVKGSLVWVKSNHGTGDLKGSFAPKHERIIHAVKGKPILYNRIPDVLYGDKKVTEHPTQKPIDLLMQLIEATTIKEDLVVDCFAGQGSTGIACLETDRNFWLCELDEYNYSKIKDYILKFKTIITHRKRFFAV